jgi:hypothetical protein
MGESQRFRDAAQEVLATTAIGDFTAELWQWDGPAAWHFVTVPPDLSEAIRTVREPSTRGFGSVRVAATIGETR